MSGFSDAQLDRLFAAILVNDVVDPSVDLPPAIRVDYPSGHLADGFALSRQLWEEGFDRAALIAMATKLGREGTIDATEQLWFKHVRAKFKHLRFAFVLYGAEHRCPATFKAVTTAMGHLQDAFRGGRRGAVARQAAVLRLLLARVPLAVLGREIVRMKPSDSGDFRRFTLGQIAELRTMLGTDTVTGHTFHVARKIISRQVSFHDDMRTIHPADEHVTMSRYLSAINGLMGQFHDGLVLRKASGDLDYARETFAFPADIRQRLTSLVERYPI
ncbi:hypothetical protein [Sphingomonas hylomeconis]|uniref:Uncharacterized protein n=1 Tax=Sphingomonas hylomeconis TaxID=1395958 RepID=A0ABV7SRJ3_9SPHN|nr:hypothetical protein [Sphingomonas hylomeconis]